MKYFFVPTFQHIDDGRWVPAKEDPLEDASEDLIGGIHNLKLDKSVPRYVLSTPDDMPDLVGWDLKTKDEVNQVYPGLIRGV